MSPSSTVFHDEEITQGTPPQVVEPPPQLASPVTPAPPQVLLAPRGKDWLNEALLELSPTRPPRRTLDFVLAFGLEAVVIAVLILLPLIYTQAIDLKQLTATYLVAPPPPPPPPPPPAQNIVRASPKVQRTFTQDGRLQAPAAVPTTIAMLKEEPLPPEIGAGVGVEGGVPGGVPGGQVGGVLGGILQDNAKRVLPIAPPVVSKPRPVRVGGVVKAPVAIFNPPPQYPALARQAKIEGNVEINAVIDAQGNVVEMKVVSGHALLVPAAMQALGRWKYQPTILNGEPVAVEFIATVRFRLT